MMPPWWRLWWAAATWMMVGADWACCTLDELVRRLRTLVSSGS
jgi:hypothetical protein